MKNRLTPRRFFYARRATGKKIPGQAGENHVMKYHNCSGTATPRTTLTSTSAPRRHARRQTHSPSLYGLPPGQQAVAPGLNLLGAAVAFTVRADRTHLNVTGNRRFGLGVIALPLLAAVGGILDAQSRQRDIRLQLAARYARARHRQTVSDAAFVQLGQLTLAQNISEAQPVFLQRLGIDKVGFPPLYSRPAR